MKALVVYDSVFGNTEKIARAIGQAIGSPEEVGVLRVSEATPERLTGVPLLIVGSPTRRFRATPATMALLGKIPANGLKGVKVAAFDTRASLEEIKGWLLRTLVGWFGYAANPIAKQLTKEGGELAVPPEGFVVKGTEGPLKEGELDRAAEWARLVAQKL